MWQAASLSAEDTRSWPALFATPSLITAAPRGTFSYTTVQTAPPNNHVYMQLPSQCSAVNSNAICHCLLQQALDSIWWEDLRGWSPAGDPGDSENSGCEWTGLVSVAFLIALLPAMHHRRALSAAGAGKNVHR